MFFWQKVECILYTTLIFNSLKSFIRVSFGIGSEFCRKITGFWLAKGRIGGLWHCGDDGVFFISFLICIFVGVSLLGLGDGYG